MNIDLQLEDPIYNDKTDSFESLIIYTKNGKHPEITTPILKYIDHTVNNESIYLTVEFLPSTNDFYLFIRDLEEYIKNQLYANGEKLFGNKFASEKINNLFKSVVKLPDKIPALPLMIFKINNKLLEIEQLISNTEIEIVFNIKCIELKMYQCSVVFDVIKVNTSKKICQTYEYLITDSDEDN